MIDRDPPEPADRELTAAEFVAGLDEGWDPPEPESDTSDPGRSAPVALPESGDPPSPDDPPDAPREPGAPLSLADTQQLVHGLRAAVAAPRPRLHAPVTRADLEAIGRQALGIQYPLTGGAR